MNWKRKGFLKLMTQVSKGEIGEIVVGHKTDFADLDLILWNGSAIFTIAKSR